MELPVKAIVAIVLVVLVLISFSFFLYSQSQEKISRTEANRIFYDTCAEYRENDCDWTVTYEEKYGDYMKACSVLFESEAGRYSCLYRFCCQETKNVLCSGICHACQAASDAKARTDCCARFAAECGREECKAC